MKKIIKEHSDREFVKGFRRYFLIDYVLNSGDWADLENELKKIYPDKHKSIMAGMFSEFKLHNYVLKIEYAITDTLNNFLIKNNKIKNWEGLKSKFLRKIERNIKNANKGADKILAKETDGNIKNALTPFGMLYCAGFGIGELIDYLKSFSEDFEQKGELLEKMEQFNVCRTLVVHNLITSREDVAEEIKRGISLGKEIIVLINKITGL